MLHCHEVLSGLEFVRRSLEIDAIILTAKQSFLYSGKWKHCLVKGDG